MMTYQSPIEVISRQLRLSQENDILKVVQEYDININKEELEKALRYDREQYRKGYADGYDDGYDVCKWKSVKDELPEDCGYYLALIKDAIGFYHTQITYFVPLSGWGKFNVTYWQPLPAPPKEVEDEMRY